MHIGIETQEIKMVFNNLGFWTKFHSIANIIALIFGCIVYIFKKGDLIHKQLGYVFATFMSLAQVYSFLMNKNDYNALHILSLLTLYWIYDGIHVVQDKHKHADWLSRHVKSMSSAFISIIIAGFGVIGRHSEFCVNTGIHWLYFMLFGALITIPLLNWYIYSLKLDVDCGKYKM